MLEQTIIKVAGVVELIMYELWKGHSRCMNLIDMRVNRLFFMRIPSISKLISMLKNKLSLLKRQASRLFSDVLPLPFRRTSTSGSS